MTLEEEVYEKQKTDVLRRQRVKNPAKDKQRVKYPALDKSPKTIEVHRETVSVSRNVSERTRSTRLATVFSSSFIC